MVNRSANAPNSPRLQRMYPTINRKALKKSCQVGMIRVLAIRVGLTLALNQNRIRNKMTWRNLGETKQGCAQREAWKWIKALRKGIGNHSYRELVELIDFKWSNSLSLLHAQRHCNLD